MARVVFIQKDWYENIGVMQLSAVLKLHDHTCNLVFHFNNRQLLNEIHNYKPDIIAFSIMTIEASFVLEVSTFLRQNFVTALIMVGGSHPTFFPQFLNNSCIDAINIGEGEYSLLELANALDNGLPITNINNIQIKVDGILYKNPIRPLCDINTLPLPDRSIYLKYAEFQKFGMYTFIISRGCPYKCNYCFNSSWNKLYCDTEEFKYLRLKNVSRCIEEIMALTRETRVNFISFNDSTFNINNKWAIEFFSAYQENFSIPFSLNLRPHKLSEQLVKAISRTQSCHLVRMGIEVGDESIRKNLLNKNISNAEILSSVTLLRNHGIKICTYNMFGLPGEREEDAIKTIEFNKTIKPYISFMHIFMPLPNTEITNIAIKNNYICEDDIIDKKTMKMVPFNSVLKQEEIDIVMRIAKLSNYAIHFPKMSGVVIYLSKHLPNWLINLLNFIEFAIQNKRQFNLSTLTLLRIMIYHYFL